MNSRHASLSALASQIRTQAFILSGRTIHRSIQHEHTEAVSCIQEQGHIDIRNGLEAAFYDQRSGLTFEQPERHLYRLSHAAVTGKQGYVFLDGQTLFAACPSLEGVADKKLRLPSRPFADSIKGPIFHLAGRNARNRAHFLVEQLPRLMACHDAIKDIEPLRILVAPGATWQLEWLDWLGFARERCIPCSKGTVYADSLYYAPMLWTDRPSRICSPSYYRAIREAVLGRTGTSLTQKRNMLFISRKDAEARRMLNEDEIYHLCVRKFGEMDRICMTDLKSREQIGAFQAASVIIGAHGQPFRYNLFASDALLIQLSHGSFEDEFRTRRWCDTFSSLGIISGNKAITLYSDSQPDQSGNWSFAVPLLDRQLDRLQDILSQGLAEYE